MSVQIDERIQKLLLDLDLFEDAMQKYEYIIDLGKALPHQDENFRTQDNRLQGCQSPAWMHIATRDGLLTIQADADALIVRGLVRIIKEIFDNISCTEIKNFDHTVLETLGLDEIITPGRQNGVASMIEKIMKHCKEQ